MASYHNNMQRPSYDQKSQYNDDAYSAPFSPNTGYQSYNVAPTPFSTSSTHINPQSLGKLSDDGSHDDFQPVYPPLSAKEIDKPRPAGLLARLIPESIACRLFVLTVLLETAVDLAIEGDLLVRLNSTTSGEKFGDLKRAQKKMPVYLALFALAHVFQFVMAVDAVYARNTLQFIALIMFNALLLIYSIIQISEIRELTDTNQEQEGITSIPITVLTNLIPVVVAISEVSYMALGWKIYHEFGWKVYKFLGADRRVKKMYANYQIYICLVKFDTFFWAAFSVQFIWLVLEKTDWEFYVTCAALPLSLILLVEGHLAARHENKWMMATFMSGCIAAMVYFVYKLSKVILNIKDDVFVNIYKSLIIFSVMAIILLLTTFVFSVIVLRNFGYGLKDALARQDASQQQPSVPQGPHRRAASTNLNRMSID